MLIMIQQSNNYFRKSQRFTIIFDDVFFVSLKNSCELSVSLRDKSKVIAQSVLTYLLEKKLAKLTLSVIKIDGTITKKKLVVKLKLQLQRSCNHGAYFYAISFNDSFLCSIRTPTETSSLLK